MSPIVVGLIGLVIIFLLIAVRMPVGFVMGLVAFVGIWYLVSNSAAMTKLETTPFSVASSYDLSTLPLFLLMANVMFTAGLGTDLYNLALKWLGRLPGGLAIATIAGCALFSGISSSSLATALCIGLVSLPEMKRTGYSDALATGSICAGGTLGILIPPSSVLIVYGILTQTSIGKLFMAGVVPGILAAVFYTITIVILCLRNPNLGPRGPKFSFKEKILAFGSCGEVIALIILVLGGLMIGWFTPTEAGAIGAFCAIVLSLIRRRIDWPKFKAALVATIKVTGMLYAVLIGAMIFQYFMALSNAPTMLGDWIGSLTFSPLFVMGIIIIIYLILGCFLDSMAMVLLTIPIFTPLVHTLGFDLIWFGIIIVRVVEVGLLTPPLGMIVFNISQITKVPLTTVYRGVTPFVLSDIVHIILLLFVPLVVLWFPNLVT
jgi:C4-dicarboxylate transporter DctM subunit